MAAIGVLARSLRTFRGGVDGYIEALVRHLAAPAASRGHRLVTYVDDDSVAQRFAALPMEVKVVPMGALGRFAWDHWASPRRARADAIDVLLCPRSFRPLHVPCASVVILYDLMYFDARRSLQPHDHAAYFRALHRLSLHRSDALAVFSRFTRDRILAILPRVRGDSIHVLPPGPPEATFTPAAEQRVARALQRAGVSSPYAIVVGAHPRKNVDVVIQSLTAAPLELSLVVVTAEFDEAHLETLASLARRLGVERRVRFLPGVETEELAALYSGASAAAYVSSYEGIGIPPLEAMACGCPVIASDATSIPETVAGAAIEVPVGDSAALAKALATLATDRVLAQSLRERGRERLAALKWDVTALGLLQLLEQAAAKAS